MIRVLCLLSILLSGMAKALADGAEVRASLLEVYQLAVANDPQLSASRHAFLATKEAIPQARAGLLPGLSAGLTSEATTLNRDQPGLDRERSGTVFQARLSQPLFRLDRWYQLKVAESSSAQAEWELAAQEQKRVLDSAKAYFETLRALDELAASQAEESAMERQLAQAKARLGEGVSNITDVLDARAAFDNARANRKLAERKVEDAYEAIYRLTKTSFNAIDGIDHSLPIGVPVPADVSAWTHRAIQQNLQLQAAEHALSAAENTYRQRQAGHLPTLDAVASYRKGDNDSFGYSNPTDFGQNGYRGDVAQGSIGLELNIPLYAGGRVSSGVRESNERLLQRRDEREDTLRSVLQQTRNAFRAIDSDVEQVRSRRQTIRSSAEALKANRVGLDLGIRNTVDVLNAQRQLYQAVRDYNGARYDFIIDTLTLKQAAGTLSPQDLEVLSSHLNAGYDAKRDFLPPGIDPSAMSGRHGHPSDPP